MKMMVYHGTDCLFDQIDLSKSIGRRDFGEGFYTTTISSQAENWARSKKLRNQSEFAYVYVYEVDIPEDSFAIKRFEGLTVEWLNMIRDNRKLGRIQHNFDIMMGPVANDNTMLTVTRYVQGTYTAEEALSRLAYAKVNDQVTFHTERALECVRFIRRYTVE